MSSDCDAFRADTSFVALKEPKPCLGGEPSHAPVAIVEVNVVKGDKYEGRRFDDFLAVWGADAITSVPCTLVAPRMSCSHRRLATLRGCYVFLPQGGTTGPSLGKYPYGREHRGQKGRILGLICFLVYDLISQMPPYRVRCCAGCLARVQAILYAGVQRHSVVAIGFLLKKSEKVIYEAKKGSSVAD